MTAALQPAEPVLATDRARRGGRAGKRAGAAAAFEQPPFRQLKIPFKPTEIVSADELESIHNRIAEGAARDRRRRAA